MKEDPMANLKDRRQGPEFRASRRDGHDVEALRQGRQAEHRRSLLPARVQPHLPRGDVLVPRRLPRVQEHRCARSSAISIDSPVRSQQMERGARSSRSRSSAISTRPSPRPTARSTRSSVRSTASRSARRSSSTRRESFATRGCRMIRAICRISSTIKKVLDGLK